MNKNLPLIDPVAKAEWVCPRKLAEANGPILISISGGSDSDIVLDLVERHKGDADIRYVWFDTGLEYDATKRHLDYLRRRYGVEIERFPAVVPIPISCKTRGVPFLSKEDSQFIHGLQNNGFKWEDKPYDVLVQEYPGIKSALKWWCSRRSSAKGTISRHAYLKEFMIENPPDFPISDKCCTGAKKKPVKAAIKKYSATLNITGLRRGEGGLRATVINSCFSPATDKSVALYRPIFFFSDIDKRKYEGAHDIHHSDCYTVYGMKRTGCAGCPFNSRFEDDLKVIEKYEPKLFKAANTIFGKSYEYTRKYREFKARKKYEKRIGLCKGQMYISGSDWEHEANAK